MTPRFDAIVVGGGPRGVATVLRVAARNPQGNPVRIALVDAVEVGAGGTWATSQPAAYLNNTVAAATTIHPDESTPMTGPASPGPDLLDWARGVVSADAHPAGAWVVQEAASLRPADFPTRRLQGVYFRDQLQAVIETGRVEVTQVLGTVVDLGHEDGLAVVRLGDGGLLCAPTVVLAQGMVQARRNREVAGLVTSAGELGLRYVEPGMPAERDYTDLPSGRNVLVRGLGATFFDIVGQLVLDWGGRFELVQDAPQGRLRYLPSGREPRLVVGSRTGVPYRGKPDGGFPVRSLEARWATERWFSGLPTGLDFARDVWPTIARELARVYVEALRGYAPGALAPDVEPESELDAAVSLTEVERVLRRSISDPRWSWQVEELRRPTCGEPVSAEEWVGRVRRMVEDELGSMSTPADHPRAAVNAAMGTLRGRVARAGVRGAFTGASLTGDVQGWFDGVGLSLASGPPSHRVRMLLALLEAGVVDLIGPEMVVTVDRAQGVFVGHSPITGRTEQAGVLLDARMSKGKVPDTDDPLLRNLLDSGRARIARVDGAATASLDVTGALVREEEARGHNIVAADGTVDDSIVVIGIPALSSQPGSAIGASPGVPSPLLAGADIAAKQVVGRLRSRHAGAGESERAMVAVSRPAT